MVRSDYGRYGNLFLSDDEYSALAADYPDDLSRYLEELSCYLAATGRTYQNHEAGIRSWALRDHSEAAEYSNIGINKIDQMLRAPNCPFVLYVGTKKLVKRKEFEDYIRSCVII